MHQTEWYFLRAIFVRPIISPLGSRHFEGRPTHTSLGGALETATRNTMHCVLRLIGLPHPPTDSISVRRSLLREQIVKLHADSHPSQEHARDVTRRVASETDASNEALTEIARNWPQRVPHSESRRHLRLPVCNFYADVEILCVCFLRRGGSAMTRGVSRDLDRASMPSSSITPQ